MTYRSDKAWPGLDWPIRRIFCIGRNYAAHARELGNAVPARPVVFMKPPSCLVPEGQVLLLPRGRGAVHHELELVIALDAQGAVCAATLGLDLTLRDEQAVLKAAGQPWELAKGFDGSAPLGVFIPGSVETFAALDMQCSINDAPRQHGNTRAMLFSIPVLLDFLARHWALGEGDIVFTGTPEGVGPLIPGDTIVVSGDTLGRFAWHCE